MPIGARDGGDILADLRLRELHHLAVRFVQLSGDVPRHLQVLLLVPPDRDHIRIVEQDVGGLEHRVGEQTRIRAEPAGNLVLVGNSALQQPYRCDAAQEPHQLRVLRHLRLAEKDAPVRVQSGGEKSQRAAAHVRAQSRRVAHAGEGVQIHQDGEDLPPLLQFDQGPHCPEVVAQVERAGWLDAG